jgi:hypothetical protein
MFLMPPVFLFGLIVNLIPHGPPFPRLLYLSKEIYPRFLLLIDQRMGRRLPGLPVKLDPSGVIV